MITESRAQFSAHSETHTAAALTALLGIEPDEQYERDEEMVPGDSESYRFAVSIWSLIPPLDIPDPDGTGVPVLAWVLDRLVGKGEILRAVAGNYDLDLSWWGASEANGISLPNDVIAQIATLGLGLVVEFHETNPKYSPEEDE